ncbi:MAG TPA: helix-hairpin-helix domain-containing protein [Lacibacter sp.]|nr:helix-hairpin-helix domain-containing protein [Lacibacter sp.]
MPATRNTFLKEYFTFTKKERRAVIILAVLAVLFSILPSIFPFLVKHEMDFIVDEETEQLLASMRSKETTTNAPEDEKHTADLFQPKSNAYTQYGSSTKADLFYFDPNTATQDELKRLGIRDKTVQTILNFRTKGGTFKKPEDFNRIYGLSVREKERLLPFVKIENKALPTTDTPTSSWKLSHPKTSASSFAEKKSIPIDINKADTAAWKSLKGIGSFYAKKIVGFRDKLGGFYNIQQVAETYGLPDSIFQTIKPFLRINEADIRQINLNTATADDLKAHPYIRGTVANAIINYRNQHGAFNSVEQLLQIGAIDEILFQKIAPYLSIR